MIPADRRIPDVDAMETHLVAYDAAETLGDVEASDLELHRCLIAASHNPLLIRLYAAAEAARGGQLWGDLKRRADAPERRELYSREHRRLVAALRARDGAGAVVAMRKHLDNVRANLLEGA